ncbi:uncharacterized protein LOC144646519 [Oculina patagonica]
MEKASSAQRLLYVGLTQFILVWWLAASGLCCLEDVHPGNCKCKPFGHRMIVTCKGIKQVPRDLPSNTVVINLSGNNLSSIQEDAFRNLTLLKEIDISRNSLQSIPYSTFWNLTLLTTIYLGKNNIKGGFYLPEGAAEVKLENNRLSLNDLKVILKESKRISNLDITRNPIGPELTSDTFAGFDNMRYLSMAYCNLKNIESGTFRAMKKLEHLDLFSNQLSNIKPGTFEGPSENFVTLSVSFNDLTTIADGTFKRFNKLIDLRMRRNRLTSVPDLTGLPAEMENILLPFKMADAASAEVESLDISLHELNYEECAQHKNVEKPLHEQTDEELDNNLRAFYAEARNKEGNEYGKSTLLCLRSGIERYLNFPPYNRGVTEWVLRGNKIEHLPVNIFQKISVVFSLDMSFNKLMSIPDLAFSGCKNLKQLILSYNSISQVNSRTFAGLRNLQNLMMTNNSLAFIPENTFADNPLLQLLFLHGNAIKYIDGNAFRGLSKLNELTLFNNPLGLLPLKIFDEMTSNVTLAISCRNLQTLTPGIYTAFIECAPSASYHVVIYDDLTDHLEGFIGSGFICQKCQIPPGHSKCRNCSFCMTGTYSTYNPYTSCLQCPAGGFYQDEMGQFKCKNCSIGTYVPEKDHPGKSATDCRACPYGTRSNETAGYRACRCLHNFYRFDRFGPCTACPDYGLNCDNDTAILAPNYFWKWNNQAMKNYTEFVVNIHTIGPEYNKNFSTFQGLLPKPLKCPYPGSCKGGISSACSVGYQGTLCATCSYNHYLRFNSCHQCPRMAVTIISCVVVIMVFALLFVMVLWGDSRRTEDDRTRTVADVIMSCAKIVIGFYQVVAGIFSALLRVQWPVILISMEKYLKFVEGNILQFAPLSCIHPLIRLDPFLQFVFAIGINILVVFLILLYLLLKKRSINKMEIFRSEKLKKVSSLKKSCYRNIFLFLLLSYPMTSKKIIEILPLPGVCVDVCFSTDGSECVSLLKADYSIHCLSHRHNVFWHIAAAFALYPVLFPLLLLFPIYKYREANPDEKEIAFGLRLFFENYKEKYWFWEIVEMYRKLILISFILLFNTESRSQIGFAVIVASASGIAYTIFRPIKGKFEDRLQTFVLWIIFFNVCLAAIYSQPNDSSNTSSTNNSTFVNAMFLAINSAVLILAVGKGLLHVRAFWRGLSSCLVQCFYLIRRGCFEGRRRGSNFLLFHPTEEQLSFED